MVEFNRHFWWWQIFTKGLKLFMIFNEKKDFSHAIVHWQIKEMNEKRNGNIKILLCALEYNPHTKFIHQFILSQTRRRIKWQRNRKYLHDFEKKIKSVQTQWEIVYKINDVMSRNIEWHLKNNISIFESCLINSTKRKLLVMTDKIQSKICALIHRSYMSIKINEMFLQKNYSLVVLWQVINYSEIWKVF